MSEMKRYRTIVGVDVRRDPSVGIRMNPSKCRVSQHAETESAQRSPDPRRSP